MADGLSNYDKPPPCEGGFLLRRHANGEEAVVRIPVVVEPVQVEVPLGGIAPEVGHVALTVNRDHAITLAEYHPNHCPLNTLGAELYPGPFQPSNILHHVSSAKRIADALAEKIFAAILFHRYA